jgi:hypothetical protein
METALGMVQHHETQNSWFFADHIADLSDLSDLSDASSDVSSDVSQDVSSDIFDASDTLRISDPSDLPDIEADIIREITMTPLEAELSEIQSFFHRVFLDQVCYYYQ